MAGSLFTMPTLGTVTNKIVGKKTNPHETNEVEHSLIDIRRGLADIGKGVMTSFSEDFIKKAPGDIIKEFGIAGNSAETQNSHEVVVFDAKKHEAPHAAPKAHAEVAAGTAGAEYHNQFKLERQMQRNESMEQRQHDSKMVQIMDELRAIAKTIQQTQPELAQITLAETPAKATKYHESFLEWVLFLLKSTRRKVEDTAWLSAVNTKKSKKGYWGMFKKHGTSFGLSNERAVATQTG